QCQRTHDWRSRRGRRRQHYRHYSRGHWCRRWRTRSRPDDCRDWRGCWGIARGNRNFGGRCRRAACQGTRGGDRRGRPAGNGCDPCAGVFPGGVRWTLRGHFRERVQLCQGYAARSHHRHFQLRARVARPADWRAELCREQSRFAAAGTAGECTSISCESWPRAVATRFTAHRSGCCAAPMFSTCLFCHASLGSNEVIETFPVGRRLAFDAERGRLWVVCRKCERWNLSPLDERWEAIEECERRFSMTKLRVSTDNIGMTRLREGLELVRIGRPLRPEFAAWRYGDQFGRRRIRTMLKVGAGVTVADGMVLPIQRGQLGKILLRPSSDALGWVLAIPPRRGSNMHNA